MNSPPDHSEYTRTFAIAPAKAMVLAAGLGTRMRPLTDTIPKPMVEVAGRTLIDRVLDRLAEAGVSDACVNTHYLAEKLEGHLAARSRPPRLTFSRESGEILGTGGGVVKALAWLGDAPFFHINSDTIWIEGVTSNLERLAQSFDETRMDALLLMAATATSIGYSGAGDFAMRNDGVLHRRPERQVVPFVYAGAAILSPKLFRDSPGGAFSLTTLFDRAIEDGRLHGIRLEGLWMHVGTPEAVIEAESAIRQSAS